MSTILKTWKVTAPYYEDPNFYYEFDEIDPKEAALQFWPHVTDVSNDEWNDAATYTKEFGYGVIVHVQERDSNDIHKFILTREISYKAQSI